MFYLYQSNRLECLFSELCRFLARPSADPLAQETIVVQNPGMARWLSQHIALGSGIAANLSFPLPATFIWQVFGHTLDSLPELTDFDRDILGWRVMDGLERIMTDPSMTEIAAYLALDPDGTKKFQLAGKIADLLDQYLVYRPDMLLAWEQGREDHWQAVLWRRLTAGGSLHRAGVLHRFHLAAEAGELRTGTLPERIMLFGINSLAPAYLQVIGRLGELTDIHVFHLSPCRQAWDDIESERLLAIKRRTWRSMGLEDVSEYFTSGNPLLASMGMLGREFFSLLQECSPQEIDLYEEPPETSLLTMLQADILNLRNRAEDGSDPLPPDDHSISFHCCYSSMREVQVLHDRLLDLFEADPELKPADILVMAPDINRYAPAVAAVFGSARDELRIPWSIADRSGLKELPVTDIFLGLLELPSGRFTASEVMALLESRSILQRFGISEDDLQSLRSSVRKAGIRWGLDREQRRQLNLDDSAMHTWEFGLERLLMGYLTGPLDTPFAEIMPCAGTTTSWLGGLAAFIRSLQVLQEQLRRDHSPERWAAILLGLADDFFAPADDSRDQDGLLQLREEITAFRASCSRAGFAGALSPAVIRRYFENRLAEPAGGQAFLSGRVTFCNMVPMRSVPFKVIWLLGMNDTDYPRSQRPPTFDLIAEKPRLGDRSRRDDDRYLFLEALLSARSHLAISWVGRDQRENTTLPASVVVAELRDYLDRGWNQENDRPVSELLTVVHPLQPFSRKCFDTSPGTAGYNATWLPGADAGPRPENGFISAPLAAFEPEQLDIRDLVRFWNHPVRYFLEQRLGLRLRIEEDLLLESEPFVLDPLQRYLLTDDILAGLLAGEDPQSHFYRQCAAGELPRGGLAALLFQDMRDNAMTLAGELGHLAGMPLEPLEIDLSLAGSHLTGSLDGLYPEGRIRWRPAALKPRDLMALWIAHLVLCLERPGGVEPVSFHLALDTTIRLNPVADPAAELEVLLTCFQQGMREPLHFYPKTSHAWAKAKSPSAAANGARRVWYSAYNRGEEEDPAYKLALQGHDPLDERFEELAELFRPVLEHMEVV
jgi:exodeoxyribonuclease V gamma subunit